jgi:lysozyme
MMMTTRIPSDACFELIKRFEGLREEAYLCPAGIPTIGYGHTAGVKLGQTITAEQAETMLHADVDAFASTLGHVLKVELSQGQFDALVSFAYNCAGWATSTLLRKVNQLDFASAASEFLKWNHADGKVLDGLTRRREAERALFLGVGA